MKIYVITISSILISMFIGNLIGNRLMGLVYGTAYLAPIAVYIPAIIALFWSITIDLEKDRGRKAWRFIIAYLLTSIYWGAYTFGYEYSNEPGAYFFEPWFFPFLQIACFSLVVLALTPERKQETDQKN